MEIEFDPAKRKIMLDQRNLDMAKADQIFDGPTLTVEDLRADYGETRYITIGYLDQRMVVIVWTWRGQSCRIISIRKANGKEQKIYGPKLAGY